MPDELETWKNVTRATLVIKKQNQRGELADEIVGGDKVLHISPTDRRINQELAANEDLDMFTNGLLSPVRLIENEEDTAELASNPNSMSEGDMEDLFKAHHKTFEAKVGQVKNEQTLRRMLEVARRIDAKSSQIDKINARLDEVTPKNFVEVEPAGRA
jgi:hypothetical protein